jgi:hypothetical protein
MVYQLVGCNGSLCTSKQITLNDHNGFYELSCFANYNIKFSVQQLPDPPYDWNNDFTQVNTWDWYFYNPYKKSVAIGIGRYGGGGYITLDSFNDPRNDINVTTDLIVYNHTRGDTQITKMTSLGYNYHYFENNRGEIYPCAGNGNARGSIFWKKDIPANVCGGNVGTELVDINVPAQETIKLSLKSTIAYTHEMYYFLSADFYVTVDGNQL